MTEKQKSIRTTMYSVETIITKGKERQEVVTHSLPWPKDSEKIAPLKARGFTFEKPRVEMPLISKENAGGVFLAPPVAPLKKWANMNAQERKEYKAKKGT